MDLEFRDGKGINHFLPLPASAFTFESIKVRGMGSEESLPVTSLS